MGCELSNVHKSINIPPSHLHSDDRPFSRGYPVQKRVLNPIARLLLIAVYDDNHPLSVFRGLRYLIQSIFEMSRGYLEFIDDSYGFKAVGLVKVKFPKPTGLNINMMPFIMSSKFENSKLPEYLREYHRALMHHILSQNQGERDKIGYLTINESMVEKGKTQRRPGLHVERPGLCFKDIDSAKMESMNLLVKTLKCFRFLIFAQ